MNILINASNLSGGGGVQVADSICRYLKDYKEYNFIAVLSSALEQTANDISLFRNVKVYRYNYPSKDIKSFITGRNVFLDNLVSGNNIDCVLTVFGPMKWRPKCPHVCGFGLSHIVMPESPYFKRMKLKEWIIVKKQILIWSYIFKRTADALFAENPLISERLKKKYIGKTIETITNNYNQIFIQPEKWIEKKLPSFEGIQLLDVTAIGPHKNVTIALEIAKILRKQHPNFKFRFVFTFDEASYPPVPSEYKDNFLFVGKVSINECPSLYQQCDIEFQPSLLECFTATYPEAMVMGKPIITTDLEFARGLCGDAAIYYDALSVSDAAECIYRLSKNQELRKQLSEKGLSQLLTFDSSQTRTEKIIELCKRISDKTDKV